MNNDNKKDINSKTSPVQMRELMKRVRTGSYIKEQEVSSNKDLSMRDMLKITRSINEGRTNFNEEQEIENKKTPYDQNMEEEKFRNFFNDMNVSIKLIDLGVYNNLVFWGGTIDGVIQFVYKVTPDENTSGIEFNYLEDFSPDNPENQEIIGRIESYFDSFYRFWRDNVLNSEDGINDEEKPVMKLDQNKEQDQQQAAE